MSCPVCRSGMEAAACLRHMRPVVVNVDYELLMPGLLQTGGNSSHHHVIEAYHDISIVWGGVRVLINTAEHTDTQREQDDRGESITMAQQIDVECRDGFDGIDVIPFSGLSLAKFEDFANMWTAIKTYMYQGALVVTDPILDEDGRQAGVYMYHAGKMCPVDGSTRDALVLATRAARDKVPPHRHNLKVTTFPLVCAIREKNFTIRQMRAWMDEEDG